MTLSTTDIAPGKVVKTAGVMFLLSLFAPMLNWTLINSKFVIMENAAETVRRILANELLFRVGIVNDLITSIIALGLALTLYLILKSVNKPLAQLALGLKVTEGVLLAVIALGNFAALLVVNGHADLPTRELGQAQALVGLFFNTRMSLAAIPMMFLGLNFIVFLSLLYKSKYVPGILAGFGVLSYTLILIYALITILFPNYAAIMVIQTLCWAPSCLFELIIGIWFLTKGLNLRLSNGKYGKYRS